MNFKEIYRSANEEICGDKAMIEKLIQGDKNETPHKIFYQLAGVAVVLTIIILLPLLKKTPEVPLSDIKIVYKERNDDLKKHVANDKDLDYNGVEKKSDSDSAKSLSDSLQEGENKSGSKDKPDTENSAITEDEVIFIPEQHSSDNEISAEKTIAADEIKESALDTDSSANSGGSAKNKEQEKSSIAEARADKDITQRVILPEGMSFEETDNGDSDGISESVFWAKGDDKILTISPNRFSNVVDDKLKDADSEKVEISGAKTVIEDYEDSYKAYVSYAGMHYEIYAKGLSFEEIENVIASLCRN